MQRLKLRSELESVEHGSHGVIRIGGMISNDQLQHSNTSGINNMAKEDHFNDPESYWQEKSDRKEADGIERRERWERHNPNHVYGQSEPKPPKE